jgi:hypothetical protein
MVIVGNYIYMSIPRGWNFVASAKQMHGKWGNIKG